MLTRVLSWSKIDKNVIKVWPLSWLHKLSFYYTLKYVLFCFMPLISSVKVENIWMWSSTIDIFTKVDSFLQWAASSFQSSIALINHEQLNIFDKFGQVMLDNLSQRGCYLPGIEACRNKTSHIDRLLSAGAQWFKINNPVRKSAISEYFLQKVHISTTPNTTKKLCTLSKLIQ